MNPLICQNHRRTQQGFTLLELIVAIVILVIAMSISFEAFTGTIRGWKRGTEVADGIKHGDFAMSQLAAALNSMLFFDNPRKTYAFKLEKDTASTGLPGDIISFVTVNKAFMPPDSPYAKGPHRIRLFVDDDEYGDPALFALPMPAISDEEEFEDEFDAEPMLVSRAISGLEIMIWDRQNEDWTDDWDMNNSVPERIELSVYVSSRDKNEEPILFRRVLEIPVHESVRDRLSNPSSGNPARERRR
jgi:prepilin-type N-terminal cleavage/methylation domain-containing protein